MDARQGPAPFGVHHPALLVYVAALVIGGTLVVTRIVGDVPQALGVVALAVGGR